MKKHVSILSFIALFVGNLCLIPSLSAQTVGYTVTGGSCNGAFTLTLGSTINGKNSYTGTASGLTSTLSWTGTQWEINTPFGVLFTNTAATPLNPPCHTVGTFVAVGFCAGGTVTASTGGCDNTPIPVELVDFTANSLKNAIQLNWQTASEINSLGFQVERSTDGIHFDAIDFVKSKGNSSQFTQYQLIDANASSGLTNYYRLRQKDSDGTESFSKIVSVKTQGKSTFSFAPNPASTHVNLNFEGEQGILNVYDLLGRVVLTKTINANNAQLMDISTLTTGNYILEIKANNEVFKDKLVKL
jgi:predicted secreted protein